MGDALTEPSYYHALPCRGKDSFPRCRFRHGHTERGPGCPIFIRPPLSHIPCPPDLLYWKPVSHSASHPPPPQIMKKVERRVYSVNNNTTGEIATVASGLSPGFGPSWHHPLSQAHKVHRTQNHQANKWPLNLHLGAAW